MIDLVYSVGDLTMHAGALNTLGVEIEADVTGSAPVRDSHIRSPPSGRTIACLAKSRAFRRSSRTSGRPSCAQRLDPEGHRQARRQRVRNFVRNPPVDALRGAVSRHIRDGSTLSPRHRELLLMRIGVLCRSEYEWAAHSRAGGV